jgi:hypothetical protein
MSCSRERRRSNAVRRRRQTRHATGTATSLRRRNGSVHGGSKNHATGRAHHLNAVGPQGIQVFVGSLGDCRHDAEDAFSEPAPCGGDCIQHLVCVPIRAPSATASRHPGSGVAMLDQAQRQLSADSDDRSRRDRDVAGTGAGVRCHAVAGCDSNVGASRSRDRGAAIAFDHRGVGVARFDAEIST